MKRHLLNEDWRWKSKSYLHHILPPFSILVVVVSVIEISIGLLHVDAAWARAASLPDLTVCAAHVDQAEYGEGDRDQDQDVVGNGTEVQAGFLVDIKRLEIYRFMGMDQQSSYQVIKLTKYFCCVINSFWGAKTCFTHTGGGNIWSILWSKVHLIWSLRCSLWEKTGSFWNFPYSQK